MIKYLNDTDEEVKLTLPPKEGEDLPTEITVKAGEEIEITDDVAYGFLHYDLGAKKVEDEGKKEDGEDKTEPEPEIQPETEPEAGEKAAEGDAKEETEAEDETEAKTEDENAEEGEKTEEKAKLEEAEAKLSEERAKLAEEKRALALEKAETKFSKLCEAGRAVPAQKEDYIALYLHEGEVTLAEGKTKTVPELLESLMESAPAHSLYEEEGKDGEGKDEPELTSEEKEVAERLGVSEQDLINHKKKEN
ncbi:MAG: hypothetical protein IJI67_07005 [Clostridia bacterium]|nr:hypothetical protein [Clostridia bacterium]